jgi:predicted O-linked N-acetylglucosamine transferase (SPINDLY family)
MQSTSEKELFQRGLSQHQKGDLAAAEKTYEQILSLNPSHEEALHLLGLIRFGQNEFDDAIRLIKQALVVDPKFSAAEYNLALVYEEMKELDEALAHFERAGEIGYDPATIQFCIGGIRMAQLKYSKALAHFDEAIRLDPKYANAHFNRSIALDLLGDLDSALSAANRALAIDQKCLGAYISKARILVGLDDPEAALSQITKAELLNLSSIRMLAEKGRILASLKDIPGALAAFKSARLIDPNYKETIFDEISARLKICLWDNFEEDVATLVKTNPTGQAVGKPMMLSWTLDSLCENRRAAEAVFKEYESNLELEKQPALPAIKKTHSGSPVHIGYFSSDMQNHPVGQLIAGVIENHDKEKFIVHVFSQGKSTGDGFENRIINAASHYRQTTSLKGSDALDHARQKYLSVAIDLNGYTGSPSLSLSHNRVAPIQVNYLGYPGTMATPFIDYIIADRVVIPPEYYSSYSEKVVHLPNCFLPNDRSRVIEKRKFERAELGLPQNGIVFCSFNNAAKYNPTTFSRWMNILRRTEGSVLWFSRVDGILQENILREAQARGIQSERIIFLKFAPRDEYFDRISVADLFLDSFPYNAHTTAADALWSGIPLLTMTGEIFASRVAASALHAVGLSELITSTPNEYEEKAVKLAHDHEALANMKKHLIGNRQVAPLFDIVKYTRDLEQAFLEMVVRHEAGLPPEHITLAKANAPSA